MLKTWLKNFGRTLSNHYVSILLVAVVVTGVFSQIALQQEIAFWKAVATTPEPDLCVLCKDGNGLRFQAPILLNLSTGVVWELVIYDTDPCKPWEISETQRLDDWVFRFLDGNTTMLWSNKDQTNITTIGNHLDKFNPIYFCHDCRSMLVETATEGYAILDMYAFENIQSFAVEDGAKYTIRNYDISIGKDKQAGTLSVKVIGRVIDQQ